MFDNDVKELPDVVGELLPATASKKRGVVGHAMGALVTYLKSGGAFASCSAFAPLCSSTARPCGHKAFKYNLKDGAGGEEWDATELLAAAAQVVPLAVRAFPILIDQGAVVAAAAVVVVAAAAAAVVVVMVALAVAVVPGRIPVDG
jgi:S-formylglutathione hydrolase